MNTTIMATITNKNSQNYTIYSKRIFIFTLFAQFNNLILFQSNFEIDKR